MEQKDINKMGEDKLNIKLKINTPLALGGIGVLKRRQSYRLQSPAKYCRIRPTY
jgi:hypothetical protein